MREREPLSACTPWPLILIAVAMLLPMQCGCHVTEVQCHGPVTVEAAVDAQAGIGRACRDCCQCVTGAAGKAACELTVE